MKKITIISILLFFVVLAIGQNNFSVHFAQTYSKFKFIDSEGTVDETLNSDINYSYGVNYSKNFDFGLFIRPELGYKNWGAVSIINNNQRLKWSLNYLDLNFGAGYIYNEWKFKPYAGISPYFAYLYKADQFIGEEYYNILDNESIKKIDFGLSEFVGVQYDFTSIAGIYFELRNSTGLGQLEKNLNAGDDQKLFNRAVSIHFGLIFNIDNNDKTPRI